MFQWDAADTGPNLGGQNVLKTFEMATRHDRRTPKTELDRVFCRWIYFHLRSQNILWLSCGGGRSSLWIHYCPFLWLWFVECVCVCVCVCVSVTRWSPYRPSDQRPSHSVALSLSFSRSLSRTVARRRADLIKAVSLTDDAERIRPTSMPPLPF